MTEDIPPQVIKETQTLLGKYIKQPPLTEKLLKKPPFKFLLDIVKSVIKETGFLGDVYSVEELSENIKDKDKKVAFLKKLITATQDATGAPISARPSKIVAGLEVTKTLQLLQSVATGIALKQSGTIVKPPVIEEKKEKKKIKDAGQKDPTKKTKSKKESEDTKEDSAKDKTKKKKSDSRDGEEKKKDKAAKEVNGEKKRDKSAKEASGEGKKRDKSAKEGSEEGKTREKSAKDGSEAGKKREKSAKEQETDKKRDAASARLVNGEEKRNKSAKKDKSKERPPSRRPSLDGLNPEGQPPVHQEENKENNLEALVNVPLINGEISGEINETTGREMNVAEPSLNVLEEAKENTEPQVQSESRKASVEGPRDSKTDKENREKKEKSDKRDRNKEGSAMERKTSSRRSSSKVRPSSKNAEKTEKSIKEKKVDEEPIVLGSTEVTIPVPKIERPQTARKAPPSARPQSMRPPSARPGAPKIRDRGEVKTDLSEHENEVKVVPVITDTDQQQDDDNMVTVERQALSPDPETQGSNYLDMVNKVGENEGALVAQILETKKELEETGQIIGGDDNQRNVEIEWEGGRKQKKEAWGKEINKLREGIQQLTRSTNPLGKLFDFLQEDVDSMSRELKMWKETNGSYSKQLEDERRMTDSSLEKYRQQLAELDSLIEQETETLKNMKANVLTNDRKIYSLITKTSTE